MNVSLDWGYLMLMLFSHYLDDKLRVRNPVRKHDHIIYPVIVTFAGVLLRLTRIQDAFIVLNR